VEIGREGLDVGLGVADEIGQPLAGPDEAVGWFLQVQAADQVSLRVFGQDPGKLKQRLEVVHQLLVETDQLEQQVLQESTG
jgi:hypothetical protein